MKLDENRYLGEMRQRLGAEDENDTRFDGELLKLSPYNRVKLIVGWELGDANWTDTIKYWFESQGLYLTTDVNNKDII